MNKKYLYDLINYRINRAHESFEEAELMRRENHWNTCANRLYYSCFYAVIALLAKYGHTSSKHAGVKSLFNEHIIKSEKMSRNQGKLYNKLFEARQEGDYLDYVYFDSATVDPWFPEVKDFINTIENLVKTDY